MVFPIIRVANKIGDEVFTHIVGTDPHDVLLLDNETGGLQYCDMQMMGGTKRYKEFPDEERFFSFQGVGDGFLGPRVEMVFFEKLCELYLEQAREDVRLKKEIEEIIKEVLAEKDCIDKAGND